MEKPNSTQKHSGKRKDAPGSSKKSYTLKDKCRQLTIGDYIELVCDNNTDVLVLSGTPDKDTLNEAKMNLISEFSELSGNAGSSAVIDTLRKVYKYQSEIFAMSLALKYLDTKFDEAIDVLRSFGIRGDISKDDPASIEKYVKRAIAEIKARNTRMQAEIKAYNSLATKGDGKRLTAQDIFDEMSAISQFVKHEISTGSNLALYASHRKNYKIYLNSLKHGKHKK